MISRTTITLALVLAVSVSVFADSGTCGLRPPSEEVHPTDLNADGHTTAEEFKEFAKAQEKGDAKPLMDQDGDGHVTAEEFVAFAEQQKDGPVELTKDNFDAATSGSRAAFVKFMAPWCGHCKTMAKDWDALARKVHAENKGVTIGTVNCDQQKEFCEMFGIEGFPTLLLMKNPAAFEDPTPLLFMDERNYDTLYSFLDEQGCLAEAA